MERYWGEDPRTVVIDEYVGTWIPLLVAPCGENTWIFALLGFAFQTDWYIQTIRLSLVDTHIKGGWGVMLDDVLAGFYALIIVYICKRIFYFWK